LSLELYIFNKLAAMVPLERENTPLNLKVKVKGQGQHCLTEFLVLRLEHQIFLERTIWGDEDCFSSK